MIKDKINFPMEVSQWKETGLSMAAYCKEHSLNYQPSCITQAAWRKRKSDPTNLKHLFESMLTLGSIIFLFNIYDLLISVWKFLPL